MKERKLKIIIVLMAAAVTGLIVLQIYWLSSLIRVEKERFQRTVNDALFSTSEMLEKNEAAADIITKMSNGKKNVAFFVQNDGTPGKMHNLDSSKERHYVKVESKNNTFRYEVKYFTKPNSAEHNLPPNIAQKHIYRLPSPTVVVTSHGDSTDKEGRKTIQSVFTEIIEAGSRKKIEERISQDQLQKLLAEQLNSRGVNLDFYFGINKVEKDSLTLVKPGTDVFELKNAKFRVPLFPHEIIRSEPNQLLVYFPHQQRYIVSSMAGMLVLSVGLILVIIAVFYKTVGMFLKQKKITEVKNDLINNITHEFKTPIATISLACEALNEPGLVAGKNSVQRFSKIIKEENNRLKVMVDTLLNTAAMEKDDLNLNKEQVNLNDLILSSTEKYKEVLLQKGGNIHYELNAVESIIFADKFHLSNILGNLVDNAIKYNQNKPEITVNTFNLNNLIQVNVSDNGIGIPKEHLSKIFDTFYRVAKGNIQDIRGNGIGLSYVKKIVEAHGGNIMVESVPGTGSIFKIILPLTGEI